MIIVSRVVVVSHLFLVKAELSLFEGSAKLIRNLQGVSYPICTVLLMYLALC